MAQNPHQTAYVAATLDRVIQRADELSEFLSIYWKKGRSPISKQVKKGLASAFRKFNEYALAKYNRDADVKLRDVLFMVHAKPKDDEQADLWKRLVNDELKTPDTWEVELSASSDKKASWTRLLADKKLGALALLRNLRNMEAAGVSDKEIRSALVEVNTERVLPFRFIAAARHAPKYEAELEVGLFSSIVGRPQLTGKTVLLIDVSGSMGDTVSGKSEITRLDAACGVAMMVRELCPSVEIYTFANGIKSVPPRRGFALRDAIGRAGGGTDLGGAVSYVNNKVEADRLIVITDEQSWSTPPAPAFEKAYMVNIAAYKNGVASKNFWKQIDGWSEAIVDYIIATEN